ncbi:hypothetical protein MDAP_002492 [Mitosporidium daphniae]|uniref:IPT/TIG domain-containing protein n=1 Tax=Mitosporidium daphniae TaxID=1485682 RepID=A0A098VS75_9MICR|nr:uncharacterized protein DI09_250p10 [Mitosporidium daphniae]KGG51878.1 hypothetical protein DI09_250p10 [Mitosporidium daphniae]|eukprot:XP_013238314.1 uncharacterized protein DI09_250p10 [Mitosporidium daphniae]
MIYSKLLVFSFTVLLSVVGFSYGQIIAVTYPLPNQIVLTCNPLTIEYAVDSASPVTVLFGNKPIMLGVLPSIALPNTITINLPECLSSGVHVITLVQDGVASAPIVIQTINGCGEFRSLSSSDC